MLSINSISKGIVIDHIKPGFGFVIYEHLKLNNANFRVALIMNASSGKYNSKDIIKIENEIDLDLTMLGFIDPNITVNIIEDEIITEKIRLTLPQKVEDIIKCKNPRCISSDERSLIHTFVLIDKLKGMYKCDYCDHIYSREA